MRRREGPGCGHRDRGRDRQRADLGSPRPRRRATGRRGHVEGDQPAVARFLRCSRGPRVGRGHEPRCRVQLLLGDSPLGAVDADVLVEVPLQFLARLAAGARPHDVVRVLRPVDEVEVHRAVRADQLAGDRRQLAVAHHELDLRPAGLDLRLGRRVGRSAGAGSSPPQAASGTTSAAAISAPARRLISRPPIRPRCCVPRASTCLPLRTDSEARTSRRRARWEGGRCAPPRPSAAPRSRRIRRRSRCSARRTARSARRCLVLVTHTVWERSC